MAENNGGATSTQSVNNGERTFTQEEVNALIGRRVNEVTSKYADYDSLKEKAEKYDQQQNEGKSELQKANERADSLQAQLDQINKDKELKKTRQKVADEMKVPVELLTGEDEESCKKQAEAIVKFAKPTSYPGTYPGGSSATRQQSQGEIDARILARQIFGK